MNLTPREREKLLVAMAAMVARRRLERGVRLNHPEAVALITDYVVEDRRHRGGVLDGDRPGRQVGDGSQHGDRVGRRNRAGASRARLGGTVSGHRRTDRRDRGADSGSRRAESWNR